MKKLVLVMIFAVSGCSTFTSPREKPLLIETFNADKKDEVASYAIAATNATRRVAVLDVINGTICVEPPPEAANTISEAFTALLEAKVADKADIGKSLSKSISQNIDQLYRRTQAVQLYRDAVFALCQNAINGSLKIDNKTIAKINPTKAEELLSFINTNINSFNQNQYSNEIDLLKKDRSITSKTIDLISKINITGLSDNNNFTEQDTGKLTAELQKSQLNRDSLSIFMETVDLLEKELDNFYATEKLRFIAVLAKPVEVCQTQETIHSTKEDEEDSENTGPKKPDNPPKTVKTVITNCTTKIPENVEKVIAEYVKALEPSAK